MQSKEILKTLAKHAAKVALKALVNWLVSVLAPILGPALVIGVLILIIYAYLFALPKIVAQDARDNGKTQAVAIFNTGPQDTWTLEDDQRLKKQYETLGEKWKEGLEGPEALRARLGSDWADEIANGYILSEVEQAEPYRLPWAVLAGVDRILGEPSISGGRERSPRPQEAYQALKPEFIWRNALFRKTITVQEEAVVEGRKTTVTRTREGVASVRFLAKAHTYESDYTFEYGPVSGEGGTQGKQGAAYMEVLKATAKGGGYYQLLKAYMEKNGLVDPSAVEIALQLAMTYDESYAADLSLLGTADYGFQIDLTRRYWDGPTGPRSAPLPLEAMKKVTSPFGMRIHPVFGARRFHTGIDLGAPKGTPVYAFGAGLVIYTGFMSGYGNTVIIDHGGQKTQYSHLSKITARNGKEVRSGEQVGEVGSTGISNGPHLHFEVHEVGNGKEKAVDPAGYLNSGGVF